MAGYVIRRLAGMVPVVLGTTLLIFAAVYALPGDPIKALAGPGRVLSPSVEEALRERFHLDQPLWAQYGHYLGGLVRGDLGIDLQGHEVSDLVVRAWPYTLQLGLTAWAIMAVAGLALGTFAGMRQGGTVDWIVLTATTVVVGVPYFVIAYVAQILLGVNLGWFPTSGVREGWPASYLLPAAVLALFGIPELVRLTRASIIENRYADYVDTAIAKGLPQRTIVVRHILRNSLVPVVSVLGLSLGYMLSGTVLIEGIFNIPGLGYVVFNGISQQNGPVVVGVCSLLVLVYLIINLLVDIVYGLLDPRISLAGRN
ncbi:ABC-type dipeptide/oligopeptide/nickel transport system permease component [Kribbella aluminosa]|uniref:ABC-type dipeptide/oligopeptide/nickel transport system permease component n=1 Tax=Kribbella aluminosa TaxID=416017 RepID=A0ABS4UJZ2_9ACTN|nr:ABC transporter permease [Kribbella aluminosa]MBP2351977.1 ABC-type dipeptide/oligopeptide/nickel transport system permease component [Kribbella aluminosa]